MPTNKRKMNRKRWKQPKITGKRSNGRLVINKRKATSQPKVECGLAPNKQCVIPTINIPIISFMSVKGIQLQSAFSRKRAWYVCYLFTQKRRPTLRLKFVGRSLYIEDNSLPLSK